MNKTDIQQILQKDPALKEKLYAWGFLFTNADVSADDYPFYGTWQHKRIDSFNLLVASQQKYFVFNNFILIGHAYNPFSMCFDENEILEQLDHDRFGTNPFWERLSQLTGIFTLIHISDNSVELVGDATCMQTTFYSVSKGGVYISSHTNILGDLLGLTWSEYAKKLCNYRFFKLLGNAMPGNITQFDEVKRLVPNHYVVFDFMGNPGFKRFYAPENQHLSVNEAAKKVSEILSDNMRLISKKWDNAAVSMTGGCDSKTTLSCAKDEYDSFSYFSYVSSESEQVDADAAHKICEALGLSHKIYLISENDEDFKDLEDIRKILRWNSGDIRDNNRNDVRKRAYFCEIDDFDIEVKSWVSEIGRSYYSKRFHGKKRFGKPTPRKCTTLYKFFFNNRRLVKQTDKIFKQYLNEFFAQAENNPVDWQEQFFWEYRVPSWNGLVITGEHRFSFDITIPYNNRKLLEILLSVPIDARINDEVYKEVRAVMNPLIDDTGIFVTNLKHTKNREKAERLYYSLHSHLFF